MRTRRGATGSLRLDCYPSIVDLIANAGVGVTTRAAVPQLDSHPRNFYFHTHARTRGHVPQVIEYIDVRGGGKCTRNVEVGAFAIDPFQCKR